MAPARLFFAWLVVLDGVFLFSVMAGRGRWTELLVGARTPYLVLTTSMFAGGGGGGGKNKTPSWFSAPHIRAPRLKMNFNGTPVGSKCTVQLKSAVLHHHQVLCTPFNVPSCHGPFARHGHGPGLALSGLRPCSSASASRRPLRH